MNGRRRFVALSLEILTLSTLCHAAAAAPDSVLVGHWPLLHDARDASGCANDGVVSGASFTPKGGAVFDGKDDFIELPPSEALRLGRKDFTIAVWVHTDEELDDVVGDILSNYDPSTRRGINLSVMNYVGGTTAQSNWRNLFFGIGNGQSPTSWIDCGRPGNSRMVWALAVFDGGLYAGTWEPCEGEAGHVYRYEEGTTWIDCGSPDRCNSICALAEYKGKLYAGSAFYNGRGSALPESPNQNPGGRVCRYEGGTQWVDCGKIGDVYTVTGLVVFDGKLYATTCDSYGCPSRTAAIYRYDGGQTWTFVGDPGGRAGAFVVHNGSLYATVFGKQGFARYDGGTNWTPLGVLPGVGQTYSSAIYRGKICLGTWPNAEVFRYDGPSSFATLGRLGQEKEVMALAVYNGELYAGTLPSGEVYRHDDAAGWTCTGQLDKTPDVLYRRVWSMAVYAGKLFAGTLPSGHVHALQAGRAVTWDRALPPGWRHIAAVKTAEHLALHVDGKQVATSSGSSTGDEDVTTDAQWRIGVGQHDHFRGKMRDLRIYARALSGGEIEALCQTRQ